MYLSMIEFSMTLKFVIKDGSEKNFQKKKKKLLLCQVEFFGYFDINLCP